MRTALNTIFYITNNKLYNIFHSSMNILDYNTHSFYQKEKILINNKKLNIYYTNIYNNGNFMREYDFMNL